MPRVVQTGNYMGTYFPMYMLTQNRTGVTVPNLEKMEAFPMFDMAVNQSDVLGSELFVKKNSYWICHNCLLYISKNKMPKIASENH